MNQRQSNSRAGSNKGRAHGAFALAGSLTASVLGAAMQAAARRPAVVLAGLAVIGGAGIFSWNATMKQTAQHPAPLFATAKPAPSAPEPQRRAEPAAPLTTGATRADVPVPPARPSGPDAIGSIIRAAESPAKPGDRSAEAKPKSADTKPKPAEAKASDTRKVADAKASDPKAKPADKPASADAKPAPQPRIASAQKALSKLGYGPIAADGVLGAGTRQAIEKFEREKNLPVTGALQAKTTKKLAALSGITIE